MQFFSRVLECHFHFLNTFEKNNVVAYISQFNQKILRGLFKYFMVDLLSAGICTQFVRAKCLTTPVHSSASCHNRVVSYAIVSAPIY